MGRAPSEPRAPPRTAGSFGDRAGDGPAAWSPNEQVRGSARALWAPSMRSAPVLLRSLGRAELLFSISLRIYNGS